MHEANKYIYTLPASLKDHPLSAIQSAALEQALFIDGLGYYYSAAVSLVDAIRSLTLGLYSWPTVKLYYSVFYSLRAIMAVNKICLYYYPHPSLGSPRPYVVTASTGCYSSTCKDSQTHKAVLSSFRKFFPAHLLLSQPINQQNPLEWLTDRREEVNYKTPRFSEPNTPVHFQSLKDYGVRESIRDYMADKRLLYAFNENHAMLAYPLVALHNCRVEFSSISRKILEEEDSKFLLKMATDKTGPLSDVRPLLLSAL